MGEPRRIALGLLGLAALATPALCGAAEDVAAPPGNVFVELISGARDFLYDGTVRLGALLTDRGRWTFREKPDWLREQSYAGFDAGAGTARDSLQLVIQQERRDGMKLLTLRYPLAATGGFLTYAGAGLSQAVYYADSRGARQALTFGGERRRSTGPAAELGAELRLSRQMMVNANVRWADLGAEANVLRTDAGPVSADPVSFGVSLGWRFR